MLTRSGRKTRGRNQAMIENINSAAVVLCDRRPLIRYALNLLVSEERALEVAADTDDGQAAIELCRDLKPDLLLVGIPMPRISGADIIREVKAVSPRTHVLVLVEHQDPELFDFLVRAGVDGCLTVDVGTARLLNAANAVARGFRFFGPDEIADQSTAGAPDVRPPPNGYAKLSAREREIFHLVAQAKTTQDIAAMLSISVKTVENHRRRILRKLGMHRTGELIRYAAMKGLLV